MFIFYLYQDKVRINHFEFLSEYISSFLPNFYNYNVHNYRLVGFQGHPMY